MAKHNTPSPHTDVVWRKYFTGLTKVSFRKKKPIHSGGQKTCIFYVKQAATNKIMSNLCYSVVSESNSRTLRKQNSNKLTLAGFAATYFQKKVTNITSGQTLTRSHDEILHFKTPANSMPCFPSKTLEAFLW